MTARKRVPKPRTTTAIRFPPELHAALSKAAEDRDVSINFLVVKAAREFMAKLVPVEEMKWTK